jgi:putative phosphoesterase
VDFSGTLVTHRLGIISDTHGHALRARKAIELLLARGASHIIHLGDVGSEEVLDALAGLEATVVFGNCDDDRGLARYAGSLGINVVHPGAILEVKSVRIGMTHGHIEREVARLLDAGVDILMHGHTHEIRDDLVGTTRVMNPGALHRAVRHTAMCLDPSTGHAEWIDVDESNSAEVRAVNQIESHSPKRETDR